MESIPIFLKLDGLFKAEVNIPAKTIQFILNLDSWQKLTKNRSVGNIGFWCTYMINEQETWKVKHDGFTCLLEKYSIGHRQDKEQNLLGSNLGDRHPRLR